VTFIISELVPPPPLCEAQTDSNGFHVCVIYTFVTSSVGLVPKHQAPRCMGANGGRSSRIFNLEVDLSGYHEQQISGITLSEADIVAMQLARIMCSCHLYRDHKSMG